MSASEIALPGEEGGGKEVDETKKEIPKQRRESTRRLRCDPAMQRFGYLAKPLAAAVDSAVAPL